MYGTAMRNMVVAPPMGGGMGGGPGGGGFVPANVVQPPQIGPGMTGGARFPSNPTAMSGGGGWLGAMTGALGELSGLEKIYLGASALGGLGNWWEGRSERKFRERMYEDEREDEQAHRSGMARNLNAIGG